jgi:hypothetical protein
LLAYRELDDVLALTISGGERLEEARTGRNRRHLLVGLLRQSVFGRLAGYEDVNDADRLCRDPAMRRVAGGRAITGSAASASQMGRFETKWLSRPREPCRPLEKREAQSWKAFNDAAHDYVHARQHLLHRMRRDVGDA